ncbi:serine/threonine-protein kinase [Allorhodopirellula solitaria]|uniref:Serine/threonine-protein kinase PknA n=1 Tax=Allorhodopirellula solitaria TaxID=2527987 RepID=A0A5C5XUL4_9BACT|nr:serine/threonine-protein kinase [Allorhodopirellula solitaria]TWT65292.1 Serine/threonine-protein kinase PknA [Allorhodopirellula solitaria]
MSEFEHLGPYKIGKVIGRGGMGSVYEATHVTSGEEVAVKLIAPHVADDMRFRRRFDAEIETLRRLRHPGIVRLIGYGEESGRLFYAMELVYGESLQQRIRDVKRMNWLPAVDIAIQITAALKQAHDMGVIHRDLKPANLLLTESNEVKIVDFGIAKLFGYGDQTLAGSVLGTADYMAPEQAGDGPVTPRTDLYALGSVMYAMMAGRSPFAGKKLTQVMDALQRDQAVPLDLINPEIPREVVEIVHDLLEKDPQKRPPTAIAVNKRLKSTRAGLQRGRTVSFKSEVTQHGPKPSGEDGGHIDTQQSHLTSGLPADDIQVDEGSGGTGDCTGPGDSSAAVEFNERHPSGSNAKVTAATGAASATDPKDSQTRVPAQGPPAKTSSGALTSFQSVEQEDANAGYLHGDSVSPPTHHWLQVASFAAMLAILAGGIYLFVRATRVPSAESMYETLQTAEQDGELTLNEAIIDRFLVHYPEDEHFAQVQRWKEQADLERTLKRLMGQARLSGGVSKLDPPALAFVKAMDLRTTSPQDAIVRLESWLELFADDGADDGQSDENNDGAGDDDTAPDLDGVAPLVGLDHLTRLARTELAHLQDPLAGELETNGSLVELQELLKASEGLPPEPRERKLRSLIDSFGDETWARPVIDEAETQLQSLIDGGQTTPDQ